MSRDLLAAVKSWQAAHGDLVHLHIGHEHQIIVLDPEWVRELLVAHHSDVIRWEHATDVFRSIHGDSVLVTEGAPWQAQRHALQPHFTARAVEAFLPRLNAVVDQELAAWPNQDEAFEIEQALSALTMRVILQMMFSTQNDVVPTDAGAIAEAIRTLSHIANDEFFVPILVPDWVPWKRVKRDATQTIRSLLHRHVAHRLTMPVEAWPKDVLSQLLSLHTADPALWPTRTIVDQCVTMFLAGFETTAGTLTWWSWCMAKHPSVQHQTRESLDTQPNDDDLESLRNTLHETLRLYPAAPLLFSRRATADLTLGHYRFPKRTMFMIPVQAIHHDARWFADPIAFKPERFQEHNKSHPRSAYVPFGVGPRVCLGQHLAMIEMQTIAQKILRQFQLKPCPTQSPPIPALNVTLRPASALRLHLSRQLH